MRKIFLLTAAFAISTLSTVPMFADSIAFSFSNPAQEIAAGQTVTFNGTVTAVSSNAGNIFLNSVSVTASNGVGSSLVIDTDDFFNNFPFFLTPTEPDSTFTGSLFTVMNSGAITLPYTGTLIIQGGADGNASDTLATASFGSPVTSAVPEPDPMLLLGAGFTGLLTARKFRKRA